MRLHYVIIAASTFLFGGCNNAATTKIGAACKSDGDCNVTGQKCVAGLVGGMPTGPKTCTHACQGEFGDSGCPIGFDCTVSSASLGMTCNKAPYSVDATTGVPVLFGKTCAADADCANTGDPNSAPACRFNEDPTKPGHPLKQDPQAYCTGSCAADSDCPITYGCFPDYDNPTADATKLHCVKRSTCDTCTINDNCPTGFPVCVPTKDGMSHYCTKTCNADADCPGGAQSAGAGSANYLACAQGQDQAGNAGKFCFHWYGACVGKGQICDPCRIQADCRGAGSASGLSCITNTVSLERICSKQCASDAVCMGPNGATCDDTSMTMSTGVCTGDKTHLYAGVLSCHL